MKNATIIRQVKNAARDAYAWPGGYPLFVLMTDGEAICPKCAKNNFGLIGRATRDGTRGGWAAAGVDIHWEGLPLTCAHCGEDIESAYGE
jgi:hypothetical protein